MPEHQPQNVAFVITELEPGGAERALTQLVLRINRERFRPFVFSLQGRPVAAKAELVRALEAAQVPVEFLNAQSKWQFPTAVLGLKRRLQANRIGLVQSFLFHANVVSAVAGRMAGAKVVAGIRVADPSAQRQRTERWLAPLVERYVCVSQSVADFSEHVAKLPKEKLLVIPNGVDVARFENAAPAELTSLGLPSGRRWLICVGRLDRQKGHDWLLPILPAVLEQHPDIHLMLVGDGPERGRLERQAQELGLRGRVHFVGWQPNVPELLKAAEVLLLPSRWEGMPNVLLEAMAAGLPVVCTAAEGTAEVLGPLSAAQLAPVNEAEPMRDTLLALLASGQERASLGRGNHLRVSAHFSLAVMATAYETLYGSLTNS